MFGDLPTWILFFPTVYIVYGCFFYYKSSTYFSFGRKKIEKATHPILCAIYYIFWLSIILYVLFLDLDNVIPSFF
jgi:hypothetical protein